MLLKLIMTEEEKKSYLQKRDYLIKTIKSLFWYWYEAEDMYKLVTSKDVTPEIIDQLINRINEASDKVKEDEKLKKLNEKKEKMIKIKKDEEQTKQKETNDLENIINNI